MQNNNQNLDLEPFEVKCINDYVHFILSFYKIVLTPEQHVEFREILHQYIESGNFAVDLSNNSTNLRNFFNSNGEKFRNIPMLEAFFKPKKSPKRFASVLANNSNSKGFGHKKLALSLPSSFGNLQLNSVNENENKKENNFSSFAARIAKRKKKKLLLIYM